MMTFSDDWNCECKVCDISRNIAMTMDFVTILSLLSMTDEYIETNFVRLANLGVGVPHLRALLAEAARMQHRVVTGV